MRDANPLYLVEWDYERNIDFGPNDVTPKTHRSVWWRCPKGHSYNQTLSSRALSHGCPTCYGEIRGAIAHTSVLNRLGTLEDTNPPYLVEWDYQKNIITPRGVVAGSKEKVWWRCPEGHSYQQILLFKKNGSLCPECAKKIRVEKLRLSRLARNGSLRDRYPNVAALWHPSKNAPLLPDGIGSNSHQLVWWQCTCGHEWQQPPNHLVANYNRKGVDRYCPACEKSNKPTT